MSLQEKFSLPLLSWFDHFGRKDLPWQNPRTPYRVWISEIMLQQTQVKTVIPYFNRFMDNFPEIWHLARAYEDDVLSLWSGLGYYSRARNLIKTAKIIYERYQGEFPRDLQLLISLPGIGPSTAAAITSQAFNLPTPILDGNVKRVLCRYFAVDGPPNLSSVQHHLWGLAKQCMPDKRCADYTQAIMDLGATCCTARKPDCAICPLQETCLAKLQNQVERYPNKKIKKSLPIKEQLFLLLYTAKDDIFLEKRPPVGLWGGLWCMPIIDPDTSAAAHIKELYNFDATQIQELMRIKHSFSHFHLQIAAIAILIAEPEDRISESSGKWIKISEIHRLGLAKPTMSIINYFREKRNLGRDDY
ncbi:A/G-specific adenine glycosylase [Legionella lansingensis]|uniref:Adenine DNA glycosylase n=1 Tax=Legionella lansingensis TaxID=45067 RepID=A0A0W0VEQ7_9GAMM|nr:A/G-specific adenine glycosylase [Legionella lansingensis]KTD18578.1 A/G specific adenine glycosylase [Legionella lansingensis]SNV49350.1 A/G-specific adenine glycosylase [Legionella lansingensis]